MTDTCGECGISFINLKNHKNIVHGVKSEKRCIFCGFLYDSGGTLFDHIIDKHHLSEDYECHVCNKSFPDCNDLQEHLETHDELHIYACKKCKKTFANKNMLIDHECTSSNLLQCQFCDNYCEENHFRVNICCRKIFNCENLYKEHKMFFHEGEVWRNPAPKLEKNKQKFICENCGNTFTKLSLKEHLPKGSDCMLKSNKNNKLILSTTPRIVLKRKQRIPRKEKKVDNNITEVLKHERKIPRKEKKVQIKIAKGKGNKNKSNFKENKRSNRQYATPEMNEKIFSSLQPDGLYHCTEKTCEKTFKTRRGIKHHLYRHFGNLTYECVSCTKRFPTEGKLKIHLLIHTKGKSYKCEVCRKEFKTKYTFNQHLGIHKTVYKYKCYQCKKEFARKHSLTVHLKTIECCSLTFTCSTLFKEHESKVVHERQCNFCPAAYSTRTLLLHHLATSHYELTTFISGKYKCNLCNRVFISVQNCKRHMRRNHSHLKNYYSD